MTTNALGKSVMEDPAKALWLMQRYGVRFMWRYRSKAAGCRINIDVTAINLASLIKKEYPQDYCEGIFIHPSGMGVLNGLPEPERAALKLLGLWPQTEVGV